MMQPDDSRVVGSVPFVDGVTRDVYEDADGRQRVAGYEGERVYGVWLPPADEPGVVEGDRLSACGPAGAGSWQSSALLVSKSLQLFLKLTKLQRLELQPRPEAVRRGKSPLMLRTVPEARWMHCSRVGPRFREFVGLMKSVGRRAFPNRKWSVCSTATAADRFLSAASHPAWSR